MTAERWSLVTAGPEHAEVLAGIHAEAFTGTGAAAPWPAAEIADLLRLESVFGLLLLDGDSPAGLVLVQHAADTAEILTLAVRPGLRRRGAGRRLLAGASALAAAGGADRMLLEVAEGNLAARRLYMVAGFTLYGRRPGYYGGSGPDREDALLLALDVCTDGEQSGPCEPLP